MRAVLALPASPPATRSSPPAPHPVSRDYFPIGLLLYIVLHLLLRVAASQTLQHDEAEQPIFAQHLALGYSGQPPLYSWLVWLLAQTVGLSVFTLAFLKAAILASLYGFLYLAARRVLREPARAALAVASLLCVPLFAWEFVRDYTHSPLACAVAAATLYVLLRLTAQGRTRDYVWLGVLLGAGMLAKYNYALFALPLLLAALSVPVFRACLLDRRLLLTAICAALLFAPHGWWLLQHHDGVQAFLASRAGIGTDSGAVVARLRGGASLCWNVALFLTPWWLLMLLCFPMGFRPLPTSAPAPARVAELFQDYWRRPRHADARLLLGRLLAIALGLLLLLVLVQGVTRFFVHWLEPILVLAPLYFFTRLEAVPLPPARLRACAGLLACSALLVIGLRAGHAWGGLQASKYGERDALFAAQAEQLRRAGFERGLLATESHIIAGNLRLHFPATGVTLPKYPLAGLPRDTAQGLCVVFDATDRDQPPPHLLAFLETELGAAFAARQVAYVGTATRQHHKHTNRLGFLLLPRP